MNIIYRRPDPPASREDDEYRYYEEILLNKNEEDPATRNERIGIIMGNMKKNTRALEMNEYHELIGNYI